MHAKPAVDELGFVLIAAANAFMMSILNMLPALQVSFSLYEMHCRWTAGTWLFVFIFAAISAAVLAVHVRHLATQPAAAKRAAEGPGGAEAVAVQPQLSPSSLMRGLGWGRPASPPPQASPGLTAGGSPPYKV